MIQGRQFRIFRQPLVLVIRRTYAGFGFRSEAWELLAAALRSIAVSNPVTSVVESPLGKRR